MIFILFIGFRVNHPAIGKHTVARSALVVLRRHLIYPFRLLLMLIVAEVPFHHPDGMPSANTSKHIRDRNANVTRRCGRLCRV